MPPPSSTTSTCATPIHIGHSTGGGEVARYVAKHGAGRVAKAVLISAVPPLMLKTDANPGGLPIEVFDGFRARHRLQPRPVLPRRRRRTVLRLQPAGAEPSEGVIHNWWRQGMMGSAQAHYEGIKAFSETDQTEDLKAIDVPTLVLHGDDDQIVPIADSAELSIKLLQARHAEGLPGVPARHVHHPRRRHQPRHPRVHRELTIVGRPVRELSALTRDPFPVGDRHDMNVFIRKDRRTCRTNRYGVITPTPTGP